MRQATEQLQSLSSNLSSDSMTDYQLKFISSQIDLFFFLSNVFALRCGVWYVYLIGNYSFINAFQTPLSSLEILVRDHF